MVETGGVRCSMRGRIFLKYDQYAIDHAKIGFIIFAVD
jgi:hypothetical protein